MISHEVGSSEEYPLVSKVSFLSVAFLLMARRSKTGLSLTDSKHTSYELRLVDCEM